MRTRASLRVARQRAKQVGGWLLWSSGGSLSLESGLVLLSFCPSGELELGERNC